ncbi:GIP [Symbiodinium sp. CCMP2592]|nr:GIP [Symbiodinium sp. CCMP2592]
MELLPESLRIILYLVLCQGRPRKRLMVVRALAMWNIKVKTLQLQEFLTYFEVIGLLQALVMLSLKALTYHGVIGLSRIVRIVVQEFLTYLLVIGSQSPGGPRAFFQGLFGLGTTGRDEGQQFDQGVQMGAAAPARDGDVLATLARGIEALLQQQQQGPRQDRPETVKPGISELPPLPEYQPLTGSIDLLHWLTHIAPMMEDLSDTSLLWWQQTVKDALTWYAQYSAAPPLARLQLRPRPTHDLRPEWARVERRATAMMLSAVPKAIREEIIAHGQMSSLDVLCKLYSVYQPGNLQEKSLVLRMLEQPEECTTALQAVEGLRRWSLWRRRAASLGMAEPDASVLVRGLDKITAPIIQGSGELSFRVSLIRSTLQVDVSPSSSTVTTFHQHLQAEMEQQARLGVAKGRRSGEDYNLAYGGGGPRGDGVYIAYGISDGFADEVSGGHSESLGLSTCTSLAKGAAKDVKVKLAGDGYAAMRQTSAGTILNEDQMAQVIVPLGKVISTLGYKLHWTSQECYLYAEDGEIITLEVVRGCPEVSEEVAKKLITRLEQTQLPELKEATEASVKALSFVKSSWWVCLMEYVMTGSSDAAKMAIKKAPFLLYKDVLVEGLACQRPRKGIWEMLKAINVNRRTRKRLMNSSSWVVRWDPPAVDRPRDALKHLGMAKETMYINLNTLLMENEFEEVWKVVLWGAAEGKISTVVAKDSLGTPMNHVVAAPHRSKVHYLHALATAGRTAHGQGAVRLLVEDLDRVQRDQRDGVESMWPAWSMCKDAKEYMAEMEIVDISISEFTGENYVRVARLDGDAAWRLHVMRGHQPFRRDCSVCVRNSATRKQHRTTMHPMAYTLSVDVVGPLKEYGKSPDGKFFKYFVIGALRIPKVEGGDGHPEVHGHPIPPDGVEEDDDEEILSEEERDEEEAVPESDYCDPAEIEKENERWKELKAMFKEPIATTTLYFAAPVNNKKAATMLPAVQKIVLDVKALGYPITRLHSDRGGEFRGHLVRRWALAQGMWPTTTSGSESASNGVAEAGVRYLKRRARVLLDSSGVGRQHWPTAVQHAAAQQRCDQLGVLPALPVAYGTKVYVKTKKYKTGAVEDFGPHWTRRRYVGPSTDIRGGHVILKDTGTFVQTTHVRITREPPPLDTIAPTVVVEPETSLPAPGEGEPPLPPPDVPPPERRLRAKTPRAAKLDELYEPCVELFEATQGMKGSLEEECELKYLRLEEIEYLEGVARGLCQDRKFSKRDGHQLLSLFAGTCGNLKVPRAPEGQGLVLGAYVHGGSFGVTRYGRDLPWVMKYFNMYLYERIKARWPHVRPTWTTLALQCAETIPRHRDVHNERATFNYVVELKSEDEGGLWVEDKGLERGVVGGERLEDFQYETEDGAVFDGCVVDVSEQPAAFNPMTPHAYVMIDHRRWFLSAYTPQGFSRLSRGDQQYLQQAGFPLCQEDEDYHGEQEKGPALRAADLPSGTTSSGSHVDRGDVEVVTVGDCEGSFSDWAIYVEDYVEEELEPGECDQVRCLRRIGSSDDPGDELWSLIGASELLSEEEVGPEVAENFGDRLEHWSSIGTLEVPRLAKVEPEYTPGIEEIIKNAVDHQSPLRHTYNAHEAKEVIEKWRSAIAKEVGVVEKGFKRIRAEEVADLRKEFTVQELPSKLVYTVKPPSTTPTTTAGLGDEAVYCRRKARVVCCGNFADEEGSDLFAGGIAAESMRCVLVYTADQGWMVGIVDVTGAFMLTPLPQSRGQVRYVIRPPAALVALGLADRNERWLLTHGMYGLRQSPRLWAEYRDTELKGITVEYDNKVYGLKQGVAEPNMWLVYEVGAPLDRPPEGLILVYVDDIMLCGPRGLVCAVAAKVSQLWKTSELELLTAEHDLRFLGCEISTTSDENVFYLHQRPYIDEILRHHGIAGTTLSQVQAPRDMVTFEAFEGETPGTPEEIKAAQRLCGELLWLAQRSRPDICYVVSAMGSLLSRAAVRCVAIGMRLLAYLQQTKNMALTMRATSGELIAYSDSSFAPQGSRSFTGVVLSWKGSPVSWRAAKQPFTCLSTAECELVASIEALTMAKSLEAIVSQIEPQPRMIILGIDNQATIAIAQPSTTASWRTRHLRVRAAYIHEQVESNQVQIRYVPGKQQWADLLTKSFPRQRLVELTALWGFVDRVHEASKKAVVKAMLMCMVVQTTRAQEQPEPLAINTSLELYVMILVMGIAVVGLWEFIWLCVDRTSDYSTKAKAGIYFYVNIVSSSFGAEFSYA